MTTDTSRVIAAIERRDWEALRPLLHPYLHWTSADGATIRGRTRVMARLAQRGPVLPPCSCELRDGQVYRWEEPLAASSIRPCRADEGAAILAIVNEAAEAYRGVIPADRWHEPYMSVAELDREIAAGVVFWGYAAGGELVGVMGIQPVGDVDLIRHAYVAPPSQGRGVGAALLDHLACSATRRMLVGTWAAAEWAIRFYRRNGFELVPRGRTAALLKAYWSIPDRQIETSVVLAKPPLGEA